VKIKDLASEHLLIIDASLRNKNRIIDEIIKVAHVLLATPDSIMLLENAKKEHQFSKAVEAIKEAILSGF
jgi:hypothetical protein